MRPLGIHHMTALDLGVVEFINVAAAADCSHVSLFTNGDPAKFPLVTQANKRQVKSALQDSGMHVGNVDPFIVFPNTDAALFLPAVELGAELGARGIATQIFDSDKRRVCDLLGQLCEKCSALGMTVSIEFMALSSAWNTLEKAVQLIADVSLPNLKVGIDALHLIRSGGSPRDVAAVHFELIGYAQLCDSLSLDVTQDYVAEAMAGRLPPGAGLFPLTALITAIGPDTLLELEIPATDARPTADRIQDAVTATRTLL